MVGSYGRRSFTFSDSEGTMLERIAISLSVGVFIFWGWGIVVEPQKAPIAGWAAWTLICFSVAISRWHNRQPASIWFLWGIGDVLIIMLIFWCGGENWAFEKNAWYLGFGLSTLVFSLVFGKEHPVLGEFLGGLSLACAYVPQVTEWYSPGHVAPTGLVIAALISVVNSVLFGVFSHRKASLSGFANAWEHVTGFGVGNVFAVASPGVLLTVLAATRV